jgi:hypothetical protein
MSKYALLIPLFALTLTTAACGDKGDDTAPPEGDTDTDTDTDTDMDCAAEALTTVSALVGSFQGSWEMYGLDAQDQVITSMTWTDTATATDPVAEATRAYVSVTDVGKSAEYGAFSQSWIEGVYIEDDCSVGDWFMDMEGVVTDMPEIEPDHFQYQTDVTANDLYFFENVTSTNLISGYHITDKLVTHPDGVETHNITRTTHLEYSGDNGDVTLDFTSMAGTHQRAE